MTDVRKYLLDVGMIAEERRGGTIYSTCKPYPEWVALLFYRYEERTGWELSVIRGRTGSAGVIEAPRLVAVLGENRNHAERSRIVEQMLDVVIATNDWGAAFDAVLERWR